MSTEADTEAAIPANMAIAPEAFDAGQVWVIKIGSSLLTRHGKGLALDLIAEWAEQIVELRRSGIDVVLVSSGAVAEGMSRLGMSKRPQSLEKLQAAAAVGQMGLIQAYESRFQSYGLHTAQVLLTHDDLRNRERYINARGTLKSLLELNVIPVVNENDTVVTDEIRFGDNDTLAALVANLIQANTLLLLTDQDGLFDANPSTHPDARLIRARQADDLSLDDMAGEGGAIGRGGMITKIRAARTAARSGANTVIASGAASEVIRELAAGRCTGTILFSGKAPLVSRKQWLAALPCRGKLHLDEGAVRVLKTQGSSLLPVGVVGVSGEFTRGEMVACVGPDGHEIARGLVAYAHGEAAKIAGKSSQEIEQTLGYPGDEELIHRDNLVLAVN
ncbi:MAG: glutamate 5-kinase [Candidatus Azotimanducaceae bacterium]